jgi:hypothetical protein
VLGFFFFSGGIFIWIIPLFLVVFGVRALRRYIESGREQEDYENDFHPVRKPGAPVDDRESRIFKLADRMKGRVTLSDIVLETGMGLKEAETFVENMIDGIHVTMEVTEKGSIVYEFPEIIQRYDQEQ